MTDKHMEQLLWLLIQIEPTETHHGDGLGADAQFHGMACSLGIPSILHPSTDTMNRSFSEPFTRRFEPRTSDQRNQDIVNDSMILIAATVSNEPTDDHSELWDILRQARQAGSLMVLIYPDGEWELAKSYETADQATQ